MSKDLTAVLISSVSKKVPLVKCVKKALEKTENIGKVIGADFNPNCIGRYFTDAFWQMPALDKMSPEAWIKACQEQAVSYVIPTRDGELLFYAANKEAFAKEGIHVMVSKEGAIRTCLDKYVFYQTVSSLGYPSIETALSLEDLDCEAYVVKEREGAGAKEIGLNLSKKQALKKAASLQRAVFQKYLKGDEISVDLYVDKEGRAKGAIARKRELIVGGESQITTAFRDEKIEEMCQELAEELCLYGHVMFQLIYSRSSGKYFFLECNPRFGGASSLSIEMGLESFYWFFLESSGKSLSSCPFKRGEAAKKLVRYPEDLFLP